MNWKAKVLHLLYQLERGLITEDEAVQCLVNTLLSEYEKREKSN